MESCPTSTARPATDDALADLAVELAEGAGRLAREGRRRPGGDDEDGGGLDLELDVDVKSSPTDLVTDVDRRVERWLRARLAERRPGDRVLGEEGGAGLASGSSVQWVVDPIDGTVNYVLGLPRYAVSVAAERDGVVVAGCVHNPETEETYRAVRGGGATLTARDPATGRRTLRRLGARRQVPLSRAVVATGFGYDAATRARQGAAVARLLPRLADIRRMGAASLDLCTVAAGGLDGYFEAGLHAWDWAAGLLVATEAGCAAAGLHGRPASDGLVVVAAAPLLPDLVAALEDVGAGDVLRG